MNFADERLTKAYGNWVKVQVAFYDFIMKSSLHNLEVTVEEFYAFKDEGEIYNDMIERCLDTFETPDVAWELFLKNEGV